MLELYQASEMIIHQNESSLEKLNLWSKELMEKRISTGCHSGTITGQIDNKVGVLMHNLLELVLGF